MLTGSQLNLFEDGYILLNSAMQCLHDLRLDESRESFFRYRELYGNDEVVNGALQWIDFIQAGLGKASETSGEDCARLCRFWQECEKQAVLLGISHKMHLATVKKSYFQGIKGKIEDSVLRSEPFLDDEIPTGFVCLQTGDYGQAISALQNCLLLSAEPKVARVYGYLGDAYAMLGEQAYARKYYLEGLLISPTDIDWQSFKDSELLELKERIAEDKDIDTCAAAHWLSSYAYVEGIFVPKKIQQLEIMKNLVNEYIAGMRSNERDGSEKVRAKLLVQSIILCDNEKFLKMVKGINFVDVRRNMKEIDPHLFSRYLKTRGASLPF